MIKITKEVLEKTREWLGPDGISFFTKELLMKNDWIHIHFTFGMKVRNFLRESHLCDDWNDIDLDDNWIEVVERAIIDVK